MAMTTKLMTAEELERLPDDGRRYELVRGVLVEMTPAGGWHGENSSEISWHINSFVRPRGLGRVYVSETGFVLARDPDIVRAPDVAFVASDRLPPVRDREGYLPLAPDLAVEVVSPYDRQSDVTDKLLEYLDAGTRLIWVVEPRRRTVTVWTPDRTARILAESDELDGGEVLPGFRLSIAEIFR
jgi:Uma2 family endonuclease